MCRLDWQGLCSSSVGFLSLLNCFSLALARLLSVSLWFLTRLSACFKAWRAGVLSSSRCMWPYHLSLPFRMTWLHLATCVLVYSSVLLIFSGHLIPSILLRKFLCRTSIWSSRCYVTVLSSLLYRNMLPTYASSVLILILTVVLLYSSIYLSLLYAAFASCFLLLMSSVVLKRLLGYLHFPQCSSPFHFIQYCSVFPLLMCRLYFCIFAVILHNSCNLLMLARCWSVNL